MLAVAVAAGVLATGSTQSRGATQADSVPRSESTALLELYAAESALARAQSDVQLLDQRSAALARSEQSARLRTEIVRRSLDASRARVAELLRALYIDGEPDPIAIILGATSLDEAMAGIEGLARATALNERLVVEARQRSVQLDRLRADLAERRASVSVARREARSGLNRLAGAVSAKRATIAEIRRQQSLTAQRAAALETQAQRAEQRSEDLTQTSSSSSAAATQPAAAAPTAPSTTAPAPATGTHTLVVDAVAYHLPGHTASGLPVGVGVIAVDSTVIPLGTRVFVPGYGPAVAADVGTAIKGNIIDLWMPTTAQALAWGRRTVTITVYG